MRILFIVLIVSALGAEVGYTATRSMMKPHEAFQRCMRTQSVVVCQHNLEK